jgi:hypothetical protein
MCNAKLFKQEPSGFEIIQQLKPTFSKHHGYKYRSIKCGTVPVSFLVFPKRKHGVLKKFSGSGAAKIRTAP